MPEHPRSDDELLSSHLDGELTDDEGARLDMRLTSEPALQDRLTAMREARELIGLPVSSLAPADADRMITTALAASAAASNVTDLAAASSRRTVWPSRIAGAAAVVIALALAVPVLRSIDNGDNDDSAGVADSAAETFDDTADDARDDTAADMATQAATDGAIADDADTSAVAPAEGAAPRLHHDTANLALFAENADFDPLADDLGDFDTTTALSTQISEAWTIHRTAPEQSTTTTPTSSPEDHSEFVDAEMFLSEAQDRLDALTTAPCVRIVDVIVGHFGSETVSAADYASATVGGAPVTVGAFLRPDGSAELLVIDQATCDIRSAPLG